MLRSGRRRRQEESDEDSHPSKKRKTENHRRKKQTKAFEKCNNSHQVEDSSQSTDALEDNANSKQPSENISYDKLEPQEQIIEPSIYDMAINTYELPETIEIKDESILQESESESSSDMSFSEWVTKIGIEPSKTMKTPPIPSTSFSFSPISIHPSHSLSKNIKIISVTSQNQYIEDIPNNNNKSSQATIDDLSTPDIRYTQKIQEFPELNGKSSDNQDSLSQNLVIREVFSLNSTKDLELVEKPEYTDVMEPSNPYQKDDVSQCTVFANEDNSNSNATSQNISKYSKLELQEQIIEPTNYDMEINTDGLPGTIEIKDDQIFEIPDSDSSSDMVLSESTSRIGMESSKTLKTSPIPCTSFQYSCSSTHPPHILSKNITQDIEITSVASQKQYIEDNPNNISSQLAIGDIIKQKMQEFHELNGNSILSSGNVGTSEIFPLMSKKHLELVEKPDTAKVNNIIPKRRHVLNKKSMVSKFFEEINKETVVCKICNRNLKLSGSTSQLTNHMRRVHSRYLHDQNEEQFQTDSSTSNTDETSALPQTTLGNRVKQLPQSQTLSSHDRTGEVLPVLSKKDLEVIDLEEPDYTNEKNSIMSKMHCGINKKSMLWVVFETNNGMAICKICKMILPLSGNTLNCLDHLCHNHRYFYYKNEEKLPTVTPAPSTADMLITPQTHINATVQQLFQPQTAVPSIIIPPTGPSAIIPGPDSKTASSTIGSLSDLSSLDPLTATGKRNQTKPIVSDKLTELSEMEKQKIDYSLIKMVVTDFRPLTIVEKKGFLEYSYNLQPLYKVPNQEFLSNHMLPTKYQEIKQKVHEILQEISNVAVTTDMWTSDSNRTFLALTSHFIFGNKLKSAFLSVKEIPENHAADNITNAISTILDEWAISAKVVTIVTDNNANIKKAIENLKICHHSSVAHTLNLSVTEAIKNAPEFCALLDKCRSVAAHIKNSAVASDRLRQRQKQMELPELKVKYDVATRWNSSLMMLDRLLELKQHLTIRMPDSPNFLNSVDWHRIHDCTSILRPLDVMTKELSAEKYVIISSIIPLIRGTQRTITHQRTITTCGFDLKTALLDMLSRQLSILETDKLCAKATFLDARFKNSVFSIEVNSEKAKKWITDEISENISQSVCTTTTNLSEDRAMNAESQHTTVLIRSFMQEVTAKANANHPVEQYLNMGLIDLSRDPLEFWNSNEKFLPELFPLSKKYLCIPASSVPSEIIFSKAGDIRNERRNRLEGERLNQILFLNSNLEL